MTLGSQRGMKIAGRAAQRSFNNLRLFSKELILLSAFSLE